ncbi:hypothetical protein B0A49_09770, partial [Cryomyces minteri]
MDGPPRRHRSSTTTARPSPENDQSAVLRGLVERLAESPPVTGDADPTAYIQKKCDDLRQIRQLLIDSSDVTQAKDSFRRARGFETLLKILRFLPSFEREQVPWADGQTETFELLRAVLNVLSEALYEHWSNRRYFGKKVEGGGWKALEQALSSTGIGRCSKGEDPAQDTAQEKLLSILFAFALGEDTLGRIFGNSRRSLAQAVNGGGEGNGKHSGTSGEHDSHTPTLCLNLGDGDLVNLKKSLGTHIVGDEVLRNAEIVPLILHLWTSLRGDNATSFNASKILSASVIVALQRVVEASAYNKDVLGSFMTYRASAELSYRNDFLPSGRDDKSEIMTAIHEKARTLLPESRVLLSISPLAAFDATFQTNVHELQLAKLLSKRAAKNLQHLTRSGGNSVVINAAVPALNHALAQNHGIAVLKGEPILVVPQSLDDMVWRIGGFAAVSLKLVELAQTKESVLRAVEVLFESMRTNWRNSEAMEKENGYGVLAVLLRDKMGFGSYITLPGHVRTATIQGGIDEREKLAADLLRLILQFCGYDEQKVEESIIINPLGYRMLLVDCDTWRRAPVQVQQSYYAQFVHLVEGSRFHAFNVKRLNRARIVKRFLEAMKGETFSQEIFPHFLRAFRAATKGSMSSAVIRDLCQFITYALQDRRAFSTLRPRSSVVQMRRRTTHLPSTPTLGSPRLANGSHVTNPSTELSRAEMGIRSLEMFTDLLCDGDSTALLKKFATTVTNRWVLHLLAESDPRVVVLGTKIIARLVVMHGPDYNKHFADKTGGFIILKYRLKTWWNEPALWSICFAVLLGCDVAAIDLDRKFDYFSLFETFLKDQPPKIAFPIVLPVIAAMLDTGLRAVVNNNEVLGDAERSEPRTKSQQHTHSQNDLSSHMRPKHTRQRSMSMESGLESHGANSSVVISAADYGEVLHTVVRFLTDLHATSAIFRDFEISSDYVQELLAVLYPVIVSSDSVSAETELNSRDSTLTFEGQDV